MIDLLPVFAGLAWRPGIAGILAVLVGVLVLCGSVYLLLATNVGARLGLLVALAGLAGWMVILSFTWVLTPPGIGPKGENPSWTPVEIYVNGPETPRTEAAQRLPQPQDLPAADELLARNPDIATEYPNGATLSDLAASHPDELEAFLDEEALAGWRIVPATEAGEAQAVADVVLVDSGFFSSPTDYKKLDTWEYGGKPDRLDECPDAEGGSFLPDDPLCRLWFKIRDTVRITHPPHYTIVQVRQVIPQVPRPGEAPPVPKVDPNAPVVSVVMVRDLGTERLIPAIYLVISLALFVFFVVVLHYRDKILDRHLAEAGTPTGGA